MSAFIVDDKHISALIAFYRDNSDGRLRGEAPATALGKTLAAENVRSMQARYGSRLDENETGFAERYTFAELSVIDAAKYLRPIQVLKLCDCYDYQACETDDYYESAAAKIIHQIRSLAICKLPGYDAAEWCAQ